MEDASINNIIGNQPIFNPTFLNIEYFFDKVFHLGSGFHSFWDKNETLIKVIAFGLSACLLAIIVYSVYGIVRIWKHEEEELEHEAHTHAHGASVQSPYGDDSTHGGMHVDMTPAGREWDRIIDLASSDNENDWRQGILEADIVLDKLLDHIGYTGKEVGEKLRSAQIGDFVTLDAAWEAHKIRNRVAHDGLAFSLSRREAIRVLGLYEKVFREFGFI